MVRSASISSAMTMVAISAAMEEPDRPAMTMAVMSGPISASMATPTRLAM